MTHGVQSNKAFAIILGFEEKQRQAADYKSAFDSADRRKLNFHSSTKIMALKFSTKSEHERFTRIVQKVIELDSLQPSQAAETLKSIERFLREYLISMGAIKSSRAVSKGRSPSPDVQSIATSGFDAAKVDKRDVHKFISAIR